MDSNEIHLMKRCKCKLLNELFKANQDLRVIVGHASLLEALESALTTAHHKSQALYTQPLSAWDSFQREIINKSTTVDCSDSSGSDSWDSGSNCEDDDLNQGAIIATGHFTRNSMALSEPIVTSREPTSRECICVDEKDKDFLKDSEYSSFLPVPSWLGSPGSFIDTRD